MPTDDRKIIQLIASTSVDTLGEVISLLHALDGELASDDGLKWFNLLYIAVSEGVRDRPGGVQWENPEWLERLDVLFAKLYFSAVENWHGDRNQTPRSWQPLFAARNRRGIMRVQFALAGMNAHINHDLPIAVARTCAQKRVVPRRGTPEQRDFERVNGIIEVVQEQAKPLFLTGLLGAVDESLGRADDMLANWSIRKARETAWSNGEIVWRLTRVAKARADFLTNLDRLVSLASRGLLVPA